MQALAALLQRTRRTLSQTAGDMRTTTRFWEKFDSQNGRLWNRGERRPHAIAQAMSALPPKADK